MGLTRGYLYVIIYMTLNTRFFREYTIPQDVGWHELGEMPSDLLRLMSLYRTALQDEDDRVRPFDTLDDFYDIYDQFRDNRCFVAGVREDRGDIITTVASYRRTPDGDSFGEGIATSPAYRGSGMARFTLRHLLDVAAHDGSRELRVRAQPRTTALWERMGAQAIGSAESKYPHLAFTVPMPTA
jgi:GNAT superfamily N-acetyltransferase